MQLFFMAYSIFPIALYSTVIVLNVVILIIGFVNLTAALTLFVFLRRIGKFENLKMYPLSILQLHYKEFSLEFNKDIKEIIGDTEKRWNNNMYTEDEKHH